MRRVIAVLGALATAGTLALALPSSASAAEGYLLVDLVPYNDPTGCVHAVSALSPVTVVVNNTDRPVSVMSDDDCTGDILSVIYPGATEEVLGQRGFRVDD